MSYNPPGKSETFRFRLRLGPNGSVQNHLACPGRPGGWITTLDTPENRWIVDDAVKEFLELLPKDKTHSHLTNMNIMLDGYSPCKAFFTDIYFEKGHSNVIGPGLWLGVRLYAPNSIPLEEFKGEVEKHIQFFVSGNYSVDWKPPQYKGDAETPFIDSFRLLKLGYRNLQRNTIEKVFETF